MAYFQVMFRLNLKYLLYFTILLYSGHTGLSNIDSMEPSLGISFPLEQKNNAVITTHSIILNQQTILPEGTLLRCCFQPPEKDSADLKKKQKKNSIENTYSRKPIKVTNKDNDYDPYVEAVKERAYNTVWSDPDLFRGYFYKIEPTRYFLVYQKPAKTNLEFSKFFFPEGLFLGSRDGLITVLSVESGSRGADAGFQPGDKIHALEEIELKGDLKQFLDHYLNSIKKNKLTGKGLGFTVSNEEQPNPFQRKIVLPLSIDTDPFGPITQ